MADEILHYRGNTPPSLAEGRLFIDLDDGVILIGADGGVTKRAMMSTGCPGGQTLNGGTASGDDLTLSSTAHATKGSILFGTSTYDEVNNRLGIGTLVPDVQFHMVDEGNAAPRNFMIARYFDDTGGVQIAARRARGTLASPAALISNDTVALHIFAAHDGTAFRNAVLLRGMVTENWSGTARGSKLEVVVNQATTTTAITALIVDENGITLPVAGEGIYIKQGTNATCGRATLVAGTVTVSTTKAATTMEVFLTHRVAGGTLGILSVGTVTGGTSFVINSSSVLDTSDVSWVIVGAA